jgi:hypothetical protein
MRKSVAASLLVLFHAFSAVAVKSKQPLQNQHHQEPQSPPHPCSPYCERPQIVRDALLAQQRNDNDTNVDGSSSNTHSSSSNTTKTLYYFGLGSNMLRSKVESRSAAGPIEILSMEPAVVKNHRLAFNMRGFPPLEPGMGSLEASRDGSLHSYHSHECHGALIQVTPQMYERIMASEGINSSNTKTASSSGAGAGYEEVVVEAFPYDSSKPPVQAIALMARPSVRLRYDPSPSERYMNILRQGAMELGLKECYQEYLAKHPVQKVSAITRSLAVNNLVTTFALSQLLGGWRGISRLQSHLLFLVYAPGNASQLRRFMSETLSAIVLLPGAVIGWMRRGILKLLNKPPPAMYTRFQAMLSPPQQDDEKK